MEIKNSDVFHQGEFSNNREEVVLLILSKDDIRGYAEENDIKITETQVDDVMKLIARSGDNFYMEGFWDAVRYGVEEITGDDHDL